MTSYQQNELRLIIERLNKGLGMTADNVRSWLKEPIINNSIGSRIEYVKQGLAFEVLNEIDMLALKKSFMHHHISGYKP